MEHYFDPNRRELARNYSKVKYLSFILSSIIGIIYTSCFLLLGWAARLADILARSVASQSLQIQGFLWVFVGSGFLLYAIIDYFFSYRYQVKYGLSVQTGVSWLQDQVVKLIVTLLLATISFSFVYWLATQFPATWWMQAWAGFALLMLGATLAAPIVYLPLFNKFTPLHEGQISPRLIKTAMAVGAKINIFVQDSSRRSTGLNASFTGIAGSRRIILGDTMLKHCSDSEIEVMLANKLAHQHLNYSYQFIFISVVIAGAALSLTWQLLGLMPDYAGMALIPLITLVFQVMLLILRPFQNTISRGYQVQYDQFALEMTNDPASFITLMAKMADINLEEIEPAPWLEYSMFSQPSTAHRIRHAQHYQSNKLR